MKRSAAAAPAHGADTKFSQKLSGIVGAAVSGGIINYRPPLDGSFAVTHPEIVEDAAAHPHKVALVNLLRRELVQQLMVVARALRVHAEKCATAMKPLPFLSALHNATLAFGDTTIYADISHMWIKSWADVVMDWLASVDPRGEEYDVDVVVLRRYMPHVLRSLLTDKQTWNPATRLELFSGGEYTVFHRQFALLPPVSAFGTLDSVELATTYVIDTELQLHKFRRDHGHRVRFTEWRAEELFTVDGAQRLLHHLQLDPPMPRCISILHTAKPVNQHVSWKGPQLLSVDSNAFIARVLRLRDKYVAAGADLAAAFPALPHLTRAYPCVNITRMGAAGDTGPDGAVVPEDGSSPSPGQPFVPAMALLHPDAPMGLMPLPPDDPRRTSTLWCATALPKMDAATIAKWLEIDIPNNTPPFVSPTAGGG